MENLFGNKFSRRYMPSANIWSTSTLSNIQQSHLLKMYTTILIGTIITALGAVIYINRLLQIPTLVGLITGFGCMFYIIRSSSNTVIISFWRVLAFLLFCFTLGNSLGPLVVYGNFINPIIIPTALITTLILFVSLSCSAIYTKKRLTLYMSALILSASAYLGFISFFNFFFRSKFVDITLSYAFILLYSLYVFYDTQITLECVAYGEKDFLLHAIQLYLDGINLFAKIATVLIKKQQEEKENKRKR
ncbi:hypothetical protein cand_027170 [Cryptosporidium andersoni]|uniref:Bax inhibitor 1 n=1 Tax=Cryptosporidium andersoni TaxID=117008 RepID=A0A1J4MQ74_9CRYT|nr:hypothetical protein cand_027170 [Cryptosporidium andersoni]